MPHKAANPEYIRQNYQYMMLSKDLEENIYIFQVLLKESSDVVFREFNIGD